MPAQNLYFIAIIPPKDISDDVTAFRIDFRDNYNSNSALKNMPHITLKAPFKLNTDRHPEVVAWFNALPIPKETFATELKDFGSFNNPKAPVIYVHPVASQQLLSLQASIINSFEAAYPEVAIHPLEKRFTPHMTIAYRDLEFAEYERAWQVYSTKQYSAKFEVKNFYLLQHDSIEWKVIAERSIR